MSRIVNALASAASKGLDRVRLTPADRLFLRATIHATATVVGPIAGAVGTVAEREANYFSERWATNHIPDPANALKAFWAGQLGLAHVQEILANHGIPFRNAGDITGNKWTYYWDNIIRHQRPRLTSEKALDLWRQNAITSEYCRGILAWHGITYPGDRDLLMRDRGWYDLGTATDLWRQGLTTDVEYGQAMDRAGVGEVDARNLLLTQRGLAPLHDYVSWWSAGRVGDGDLRLRLSREGITSAAEVGMYLQDYKRIGLDDALGMYRLGKLTDVQLREIAQKEGFRDSVTTQLLNIESPLSIAEAINLAYRSRDAQPVELVAALTSSGIVDPQRRLIHVDSKRPLPSLNDGFAFAHRAAFDDNLAARWQLDVGIPEQYRDLAAWQGADWNPSTIGPVAQPSNWPSLDTAYWRSNVSLLTIRQGIEALRRLSGPRHLRYADIAPGITEFTSADLSSLYVAHGYSPVHAKWDMALATPEIPIGVVLGRLRIDRFAAAWARTTLLRLGYLPADADDIIASVGAQREWRDNRTARALANRAITLGYQSLQQAYTVGTWNDAQATSALLNIGLTATQAAQTVTAWAAEANLAYMRDTIARLKREYMDGVISVAEASTAMTAVLIPPPAIQRTIARWQVQRTWKRRAASSSQILRWVARGLLTATVAQARLFNLGWTAPDVALQLAEAQGQLAKANAAQVAAMGRARSKAASQLEKVSKQHARAIADAQSKLKRLTPLSSLKTWLKDGIASEQWVRARLLAMGYDPAIVQAHIEEWQQGKGAPPAAQVLPPAFALSPPPPPPPPPPTTIQPGITETI